MSAHTMHALPHHLLRHVRHFGRGLDGIKSKLASDALLRSKMASSGSSVTVACIMKGGKVLTSNLAASSKASPRVRPHLQLCGNRRHQTLSVTRHAEVAALNQLPASFGTRHLRHCVLVVVRMRFGEWSDYSEQQGPEACLECAKPCLECAKLIESLCLRAVVYSDAGELRRQTPTEIRNIATPSSGTRARLRKKASIAVPA